MNAARISAATTIITLSACCMMECAPTIAASSGNSYIIVADETNKADGFGRVAAALADHRQARRVLGVGSEGLDPVFNELRLLKPRFVVFVVPAARIEDNFVGEVGEQQNPAHIQSLARVVLIGDPAYRPFPEKRQALPVPPERMVEKAASENVLSKMTVGELIAGLDVNPSPGFAELNELVRRGKSAVPGLVAALKTSESWQVPKALGASKDPEAVDPLIEALARRPWSPYREVTVEALESITGQKAGSDAHSWKLWRSKNPVR